MIKLLYLGTLMSLLGSFCGCTTMTETTNVYVLPVTTNAPVFGPWSVPTTNTIVYCNSFTLSQEQSAQKTFPITLSSNTVPIYP